MPSSMTIEPSTTIPKSMAPRLIRLAVTQELEKRVEKIQHLLPEGVSIEPYLNRSELVNRNISTVVNNLIEGAIIVFLVLILFLGNIRAGLIVASVIPLAMLFAFIMMRIFNQIVDNG